MKKTTKVATTSNVAKGVSNKSTKAESTTKTKVTIKTKVSDKAKEAVKKVSEARMFQGVEQFLSIDAKVIKTLGLKLTRYIKKDGTESNLYILTGKEKTSTKALHDFLTSKKMSKLCSYWGFVSGYKIPQSHLEEFCKATGLKVKSA